MGPDAQNLDELRRRIQEDPASLVFSDLAEECRRRGLADEAVSVARAGLGHHPSHLAARVTLGRALIDLNRLDAAFVELTRILDEAPGNVPAIRALAEIDQRRGNVRATDGQTVADLFDFDTLLAQLGKTPPSLREPVTAPPPATSPLQAFDLADDEDDFAVMERHLREFEDQRARDERLAANVVAERRRLLMLQNLEHWLGAILADKSRPIV